jgi:glycosyltransferase involved in cell wall biosynthesis
MPQPAIELSIVVPIFNEIDNIEPLVEQLTASLEGTGRSYEILCIDDGSTDGSDRGALPKELRADRSLYSGL